MYSSAMSANSLRESVLMFWLVYGTILNSFEFSRHGRSVGNLIEEVGPLGRDIRKDCTDIFEIFHRYQPGAVGFHAREAMKVFH